MNMLFSEKLLKEFNSMLAQKETTEVKLNLNAELKGDEVDIVNEENMQKLSLRLNSRNILFMKKVEKAKEKILNGTFGICEECSEEIEAKRMIARPTATLCIACKEEKEKEERNNINHRRDLASNF